MPSGSLTDLVLAFVTMSLCLAPGAVLSACLPACLSEHLKPQISDTRTLCPPFLLPGCLFVPCASQARAQSNRRPFPRVQDEPQPQRDLDPCLHEQSRSEGSSALSLSRLARSLAPGTARARVRVRAAPRGHPRHSPRNTSVIAIPLGGGISISIRCSQGLSTAGLTCGHLFCSRGWRYLKEVVGRELVSLSWCLFHILLYNPTKSHLS